MVWVSNLGNSTIDVSITNKSGGSTNTYAIAPQFQGNENTGMNNWGRSGPETLTVRREGGKEQSLTVGPCDFVQVYSNAVIVSQANMFAA